MPQGYLASGDAYPRRYDEVIKDVPRKVKIVDDTLLYDSNIEGAFFHTFDFLLHCAKNGIVFNWEKFQFYQDTVQFGSLQITPSGITSSEPMLEAILSFPIPRTLTDTRSWFGLVNQVAWAYSLGPVMLPFRDLVILYGTKALKMHSSIQKSHSRLCQKRYHDIRKKSSNMPHPRLEQRENGLPTAAKILHVHDWQSSCFLSRRLVPYICRQQILHWCRTPIRTYRGRGSSNSVGIGEVLDIRNGLSEPYSGYRPPITKGTIWR